VTRIFVIITTDVVDCQIFEDGACNRGRLKVMGRDVVKEFFSDQIEPSMPFGHNSAQQVEAVAEAVREVIDGSLFLKGPDLDANVSFYISVSTLLLMRQFINQGRTDNFAHPAAIELCKQFYYSKSDSLASLFPNEFASLPKACLVMAYTCVCVALFSV
jgi:hypothetical protein